MKISLTCLIVAVMLAALQVLQNHIDKENKTYILETISVVLFFTGAYFAMRGV